MRVNRLFRLGSLLLAGSMLTGCGTFFGSSGVSTSNNFSAKASASGSVTPTKAAGQGTAQSASTVQVSDQHVGPGSSYPSFGLDVSGPEVLALNERLAELGYLPVQIASGQTPHISQQNLNNPPQVTFIWRYQNVPSELRALWNPNWYTQMTRAAVIAVERANGLPVDGITGPSVWKALLAPNAVYNPHPYTFVLVKKNPAPETLRVWQSGKWVYQSVANTGIPQMTTTDGTYAVYLRFVSQTMTGVNPNGSHYSDKGVPYVNYFNGSQAIHGFVRANYGFPQSLGCVELPVHNAETVWSYLHYGTVVSITGHYITGQTAASTSSTATPSGVAANQGAANPGVKNNQSPTNSRGTTSNPGTSSTKGQSQTTGNSSSNQAGNSSSTQTGSTQSGASATTNSKATSNSTASSTTSNTTGNTTSFNNQTPAGN